MKSVRPWSCFGVGGLALALSAGCNSAQKHHAVEAEQIEAANCDTCAAAQDAPAPIAVPVTIPVAPIAESSRIPDYTTAKVPTPAPAPVKEEVAKRRSYADITADPKFSHAADYTWLVGKLQYIHGKNQWRLRFASVDEEDRIGGSVTLSAGENRLRDLKEGQLVRVEGQLIDPDSREVAPAYRILDISPAD